MVLFGMLVSGPGWAQDADEDDFEFDDGDFYEAGEDDEEDEDVQRLEEGEREALLDYLLTGEADTESSEEGGECSHARGDGSGTGALAIGLGLWGLLLRRRPVRVRPFAADEGQA